MNDASQTPPMQFVPVTPQQAEGYITHHYSRFMTAMMGLKSNDEQVKNATLFLDTGFIWLVRSIMGAAPGALMLLQPVSPPPSEPVVVVPPAVSEPEAA
jgi:hypothetical protein